MSDNTYVNAEGSGSARLFRAVGESFGVDIGDRERQDWRVLLGALYVADHLIDDRRESELSPLVKLLEGDGLPGIDTEFQEACWDFMANQTPERRQEIYKNFGQMAEFASQLRATESIHELIRIRLQDAGVFADLLSLPTTDTIDPTERDDFNDWLLSFSRTGYLVNSLHDLGDDYQTGETSVKPTPKARLVLARSALRETIIGINKTPLRTIGSLTMVAFRYEVLGRKPYIAHLEH